VGQKKGILEEVGDVQAERKKKVVMENLGSVEETVGVGSVVEGCFRSGRYGEAVEVEMRIANLARKLDPDGRGVVWGDELDHDLLAIISWPQVREEQSNQPHRSTHLYESRIQTVRIRLSPEYLRFHVHPCTCQILQRTNRVR